MRDDDKWVWPLNEPLTASVTQVCNGARSSRNIVITSSPSGNWSISNSITYKGSDGWALNGNITIIIIIIIHTQT